MKPVRILWLNGGALDYGGISTFMMNYLSHMDRTRVAVDILVHGVQQGPREQEAVALGAKVMHVPYKRDGIARNRRAIRAAMAEGRYDIVHAHMDGENGAVLSLARDAGILCRMSHSHNTSFLTENPLKLMLLNRSARRIPSVATHLLACSEAAGRFLYGDAAVDAGCLTVVKNAIVPAAFRFDAAARNRMRERYRLGDTFVVGHIGRLDYQKNQAFLLDAFAAALHKRPDMTLLMAGDGADRAALEAQAARLGVDHAVRMIGYCGDIPALLSAMDAFVLPSRFEGLGIVLIEAQASGLPCYASDAVPRDTLVTNCAYLPLTESKWADALASMHFAADRTADDGAFAAHGYDVEQAAEALMRLYEEAVK